MAVVEIPYLLSVPMPLLLNPPSFLLLTVLFQLLSDTFLPSPKLFIYLHWILTDDNITKFIL